MTVGSRGHDYPDGGIRVIAFSEGIAGLCSKPPGHLDGWPPLQIRYLDKYLSLLQCKTIVVEAHYVDRDYIEDSALFYARSLRSYPNFCERLHFFSEAFDAERWRVLATDVKNRRDSQAFLQSAYLGFLVMRPLPGAKIGRTVLATLGPGPTADGARRVFGAVRRYSVNVAGFELSIVGLAFQQQDRGVSACATTALWSALHYTAPRENLSLPTPAQITQSACRYLLHAGRSLPSEGLTIEQICEAVRAAGLAPLVVAIQDPAHAKAHLLAYTLSGLPPVMVIRGLKSGMGHAVCTVGVKLAEAIGPAEAGVKFREASSAMTGVYIHDDRLGPYAIADLANYDDPPAPHQGPLTSLKIRFPTQKDEHVEESWLQALVVPVPLKLRMTATRMRVLALNIAEATTHMFPELPDKLVLKCGYRLAAAYRADATGFGLSNDGLYALLVDRVLSRFVGLLEFSTPDGPLFDVLIDATETEANPSVLACVCRTNLTPARRDLLAAFAEVLGAPLLT